MSTANGLQGGLAKTRDDNKSVLEEARKKLVVKKERQAIDLLGLLKKPSEKRVDGQRMSSSELSKYVDELADGAFDYVGRARAFLRQLDKDVEEIGKEIMEDLCEDGNDTRRQRADEYESFVSELIDYAPENDTILRQEAEVAGRRQFVEALCLRVSVRANIGLLADDLRYAEDKEYLEYLLEESKDGGTGRVFVKSSAKNAPIRAFGKGYELAKDAFGERHHEFAIKKLAEAVAERSRDLAMAYKKAKDDEWKQEVSADDDELMSPEALLFGNVDEGTAVLPWKFQGHDNSVKLRRSGARLYVVGAIGSPLSALEAMRQEHKEPFVILRHILAEDGEHLCFGEMVDGRPRYKFTEIVSRSAFAMTLWVRTAAGANCPNRLLSEDNTRQMFIPEVANGKKPNGNGHANGNGFVPRVPLVDSDGKELVEPEVFWFRKENGGAGSIIIACPKGFVLNLPEGYDQEHREPISPERDVVFAQETTKIRVRRFVAEGKPNVVIDDCDDHRVYEELRVSGLIGDDVPEGNWLNMGLPWAKLMPYGYKQACESGQIKPRNKE